MASPAVLGYRYPASTPLETAWPGAKGTEACGDRSFLAVLGEKCMYVELEWRCVYVCGGVCMVCCGVVVCWDVLCSSVLCVVMWWCASRNML